MHDDRGVVAEVPAPHPAQQLARAEGRPGVPGQEQQQVELPGCQRLLRPCERRRADRRVQRQRSDGDRGRPVAGPDVTAAQQSVQPEHELARAERLGEVVVGAELQPDDPVVDGVEAREQHHGRPVGVEAHPAQQVQTRRAGQADVEDHRVRSRLAPEPLGLARVARDARLDPVGLQVGGDAACHESPRRPPPARSA